MSDNAEICEIWSLIFRQQSSLDIRAKRLSMNSRFLAVPFRKCLLIDHSIFILFALYLLFAVVCLFANFLCMLYTIYCILTT